MRVSGGRANASQIVDAVFKVSHIDEELAGLLVGDLVKDDRRFKIIDGNTIELQPYDCESRLLDELDFVVVDIEATGAKMPPNRIIELGAYRIRGGRIVDNFITLVNPEISIPRFVIALTGISNEMVKQAPLFAEVAPTWLEFVEDAVLIAHNAPFDTNFLNHEISRVYPGPPDDQSASLHRHSFAARASRPGKLPPRNRGRTFLNFILRSPSRRQRRPRDGGSFSQNPGRARRTWRARSGGGAKLSNRRSGIEPCRSQLSCAAALCR